MFCYVNNFIFSRDPEKAREYWGRYINFDNSHIVGKLVDFFYKLLYHQIKLLMASDL